MKNEISTMNINELRNQFKKLIRAPLGWDEDSFNQWKQETMSILNKLGIPTPAELQDDLVQDISEDGVYPIIVNGGKITDCSKPEPKNAIDRTIEIEKWKEFLNELLNKLERRQID